jgi:hypothetical protein
MEDYSRFIRHSSDEIRCAKEKLIGMFIVAGPYCDLQNYPKTALRKSIAKNIAPKLKPNILVVARSLIFDNDYPENLFITEHLVPAENAISTPWRCVRCAPHELKRETVPVQHAISAIGT